MLQVLREDLKQAMKDKDNTRKSIIQIVRANITNLAKEERLPEEQLTNEDILGIICKEVKQQNDSLEAFKSGNRLDLVSETERNIEILMGYLPKQLSKEEIEEIVKDILMELGIETLTNKDRGVLMKELMPRLKGKADGKLVNEVVTNLMRK